MRRSIIVLAAILVLQLLAASALAQDKLAGRWVGKVKSPRGERDTNATFKKEGDNYTGTISGFMPGQEVPLKNIKVDGDKDDEWWMQTSTNPPRSTGSASSTSLRCRTRKSSGSKAARIAGAKG